MANIFEIGNLYCSYVLSSNGTVKRKPVLHVKDINIPRDKITFVLGSSGSGKSTFMEAIALMSDTIHRCDDYQSENLYYINQHGAKFDILKRQYVGKSENNKVNLDNFRFNNFSFIFQATNLMGNFSALENVAITDYIHDPDMAEDNARDRLIKKLEMTDIRSFDKRPNEYSGGQRQRFAFARALGAKAKVLFGDEPTGNLDHNNSFILLKILRNLIKDNIIKENDGIRNAILVSHSLELALSFADLIIIIIPPVPRDENEDERHVVAMGRSNQLLVYDNEKIKWREGEVMDKENKNYQNISKEISFLLNYEFTPINNLFVDIYDKIYEDHEIDEHELEYFQHIKSNFIESFSYNVTFENKNQIDSDILLKKVDEIDKKLELDESYYLSKFIREYITLNWKKHETPKAHN
jgi:ABC-type lipoprotein export system ATPase subunit